MLDEKPQHGKSMGLAIMIAAAVACVAIIAASAVVAKKPPHGEDFLPRAPREEEQGPPPVATEDDAEALEEEPRPAELLARARTLVASGSPNRAQIEGLLLGAIKARPGDDDSIEAFRLLHSLHEKWREEDLQRSGVREKAESPRPLPARVVEPVETRPAIERIVLYRQDFERGGGNWTVEPSWAPARIRYKEPPRTVFDPERGGQVLKLGYTPQDEWHPRRAYDDQANVPVTPGARISFWYRTEGELSLIHAQHSFVGADGKPRNHVYRLSPSRAWKHVDQAVSSYSPLDQGAVRMKGTITIRSARVYAGMAGEEGECYIDDFVIYSPAPAGITPAAVKPAAPAPTQGFVSLIGPDLSNWGRPSGGTWKVDRGAILAECPDVSGYLYTRRRFRDFTLKLHASALATTGYAPHFKVRFRWAPEKGKYGCQVDLTTKAYFYGVIAGEDKPVEQVFDVPVDLRPQIGTSVEMELVAIGESVTMLVNGREIFSGVAKITEPGLLAICANRSSILFEKVEAKEH